MSRVPEFLSTEEGAIETGNCRGTLVTACRKNPGFAIRVGHAYKIPREHLERVKAGETPAQIAAEVRARVNGASRAA
jgi:hypothetical protein